MVPKNTLIFKLDFIAPNFLDTQFYYRVQSDTQKPGTQKQNVLSTEKEMETMLLLLYILNNTDNTGSFHFWCISIEHSCNVGLLVSDSYLNLVWISKHPSHGWKHVNMMKACNFTVNIVCVCVCMCVCVCACFVNCFHRSRINHINA